MPVHNIDKISFYIVAHADDWQLFMCPGVHNDLFAHNTKVVFIITTAGDAGADKNYWLAREEGAKSSIRFCLAANGDFLESGEIKEFNGHAVYYWCAGNAVIYFLRVPDGNLDGSGFSANNFQSLSKLKTGEINLITSTDNSAIYYGWKDFCVTLQQIILAESADIKNKWLHYLNPDMAANSNDHADHIATGEAIQSLNIIADMWQTLYAGYSISNTSNKLSTKDFFWKAGMFAAYEKAVFDNCGYSTLCEDASIYINWCSYASRSVIIKPGHTAHLL